MRERKMGRRRKALSGSRADRKMLFDGLVRKIEEGGQFFVYRVGSRIKVCSEKLDYFIWSEGPQTSIQCSYTRERLARRAYRLLEKQGWGGGLH